MSRNKGESERSQRVNRRRCLRALATVGIGAVAGCGGGSGNTGNPSTPTVASTPEMATPTETQTATPSPSPTASPTPTEKQTPMSTPGATETPTEPGTPAPPPLDQARLAQLIHERILDERIAENVGSIAWDEELQRIAEYHSEDMAENEYFAHQSPDGETYEDRYLRFGYNCMIPTVDGSLDGAENIALHWYSENRSFHNGEQVYSTETGLATAIVDEWMNAETPRQKILTSQWENEGIGVATRMTANGLKVYITQNFC